MDANQSGKSSSRRSSVERSEASKHRSASAISRDERRCAAKYESKKDESKKDKAAEPAGGAEEGAKDNSTPTGKRKGDEVFSPLGLTPKNKTTNKYTFIFDIQNNSQYSHKFVSAII